MLPQLVNAPNMYHFTASGAFDDASEAFIITDEHGNTPMFSDKTITSNVVISMLKQELWIDGEPGEWSCFVNHAMMPGKTWTYELIDFPEELR